MSQQLLLLCRQAAAPCIAGHRAIALDDPCAQVILLFPHVFWGDNVDMFGRVAESTTERGEFFLFYSYAHISGRAPSCLGLITKSVAPGAVIENGPVECWVWQCRPAVAWLTMTAGLIRGQLPFHESCLWLLFAANQHSQYLWWPKVPSAAQRCCCRCWCQI